MNRRLRIVLAVAIVSARSLVNRFTGRGDDAGLAKRCKGGCGDGSVHDAHLALGSLTYLAR